MADGQVEIHFSRKLVTDDTEKVQNFRINQFPNSKKRIQFSGIDSPQVNKDNSTFWNLHNPQRIKIILLSGIYTIPNE
jgi:hypothetical protein